MVFHIKIAEIIYREHFDADEDEENPNPDRLSPPQKGALQCLLTGSTWSAVRINENGNASHCRRCPRCTKWYEHEPEEDDYHTFWSCKANDDIEDPIIHSTNELCAQAYIMCESEPCLWLRGISPTHYAVVPALSIPTTEYRDGMAHTVNKDPEKELIVCLLYTSDAADE